MVHPFLTRIFDLGVPPSALRDFDLLLLPENSESAPRSELREAQHALSVAKMARAAGYRVATATDFKVDAKLLERRDSHLWLGVIAVVQPIVLSVVARFVYDWLSKSSPAGRDKPQVTVKLRVIREDQVTAIDYSGDADAFVSTCRAIAGESTKTVDRASHPDA